MDLKQHLLAALREEFDRWEELLASLADDEITTPRVPSDWTIKDVIAHLWAWQQRSIARIQAARLHREPQFPIWPSEFDPDGDGVPDPVNAWIYKSNRDQPRSSVHDKWREGSQQFLEAANALPKIVFFANPRPGGLEPCAAGER